MRRRISLIIRIQHQFNKWRCIRGIRHSASFFDFPRRSEPHTPPNDLLYKFLVYIPSVSRLSLPKPLLYRCTALKWWTIFCLGLSLLILSVFILVHRFVDGYSLECCGKFPPVEIIRFGWHFGSSMTSIVHRSTVIALINLVGLHSCAWFLSFVSVCHCWPSIASILLRKMRWVLLQWWLFFGMLR